MVMVSPESGQVSAPRDAANCAVTLRGIGKSFGTGGGAPWRRRRRVRLALAPLDLDIATGSTTGIIGVNGSGKSTLIRILATLMTPDTGRGSVFGHDLVAAAQQVRRHVNRVSVDAAFFKMLSPWENLVYAARLYGAAADARSRSRAALRRLGLDDEVFDRPLKELSRGQQQKVAIARSLLTTPSLLLLDEPTTGLDPHSRREVQELIREVREERDVTVVLCTHDLAEAEALCDRVVILDRGALVAEGAPDELGRRHPRADGCPARLEEVFLAITGRSLADDPEEEAD